MRRYTTLVCLSLAACCLGAALKSPGAAVSRSAHVQEESDEHDESPLGHAMEGLQNGMRRLRGLVKDAPERAACLEVLHDMQAGAIAALQLDPPAPEDREAPTGDALALWRVGYKRQVLKLADKLYELELAVLEGRMDALQKGYSELNEIKNDGHYEYQ